MERIRPRQILKIFESCLKTRPAKVADRRLSDLWGILFSHVYLSAEELLSSFKTGEHRLGVAKERMLRDFIRTDCADRGTFVLEVINTGGKIDRAALIMIADLENLAMVERDGTTAIHKMAEACDEGTRPALIEKAGKELLARTYDSRGIPVLLSILSLADLRRQDLDAIRRVFLPKELAKVMARSRTGENALNIFTSLASSLRKRGPSKRNKFEVIHAVKTTNMESALRSQINNPGREKSMFGPQVKMADGEVVKDDESSRIDQRERYESLLPDDPFNLIGNIKRKRRR